MSSSIKSPDSSDWDHYWKLQARGQKAYGFVANLYRKYIIKGTLNHHVLRHFSENSLILHAGSGSGEVDLDICQLMEVVAIDFSSHALSTYTECHPDAKSLSQADIFQLPFPNATFDGVFNLGVMEHFNDVEMVNALTELRRVIKNNGKIFWKDFGWVNNSYDITAPVLSYSPNHFKLYNLAGNVEEYVAEKGITKGGGWKDTGYYLQNFVSQTYDSTEAVSCDRGFRVAMEILR